MGRHWKPESENVWRNNLEYVSAFIELTSRGLKGSVIFGPPDTALQGSISLPDRFDPETGQDRAKLATTKLAQDVERWLIGRGDCIKIDQPDLFRG